MTISINSFLDIVTEEVSGINNFNSGDSRKNLKKGKEVKMGMKRRSRNCGREYDLSDLSYTAKSWKMFYCCESCAREAGVL